MSHFRLEESDLSSQRNGMRPRSPSEALEPARAPSRPRGKIVRERSRAVNGFVRAVSGMMTLVLFVMVAGAAAGVMLYHQFERPGPLEVSRTIVIAKGEGRIEIAETLEREGVISNRWVFLASHMIKGWMGSKKPLELKAGDYEIKKQASMADVLDAIVEGRAVLDKLTIPEGLTSQQIVERLRAEPDLTGEIAQVPPEGTLLPDTYRFSKGMARQELLDRMQAEQKRLMVSLWEKRQQNIPVETPEQALILASIVEKETGRADERERVAAVFVNRLRKKMRLQSDPTIIYGVAGGQGSLGRPILRSEIEQKTAYNTYQIDGLPPTPICNPGRPAIEATLNPAKTNELYFVADGTGGHSFSETLKEHNAAVSTWRKIEKEAKTKDATPANEAAAAPVAAPGSAPTKAAAAAAPAPAPPRVINAKDDGVANAPVKASTVPLPVRKPKN